MKKRFFSCVLAFAFMLASVVGLTACGDVGVNLHNKTYTFGEAEYAFYITEGATETKVDNINAFVAEHLETIIATNDSSISENATSAETLINYLKQNTVNENNILIANAVITIGKETKIDEATRESAFTLTQGGKVFSAQIRSNTYNKDRKQGTIFGNDVAQMGSGFTLTDYNVKDGTIKAVKVDFARKIVDPNNPENVTYFNYKDAWDSNGILFETESAKTLICRATTSLVSVAENA